MGGPFGHACEAAFFECIANGEAPESCWEVIDPCLQSEQCEHIRALCLCDGEELATCDAEFDECEVTGTVQ